MGDNKSVRADNSGGNSSLVGITKLMNPYLVDDSIDLDKIEDAVLSRELNESVMKKDIDYDKEVQRLAADLGIDFSVGDIIVPKAVLNNISNKKNNNGAVIEEIDFDEDAERAEIISNHSVASSRRSRCSHCSVKLENEISRSVRMDTGSVRGTGNRIEAGSTRSVNGFKDRESRSVNEFREHDNGSSRGFNNNNETRKTNDYCTDNNHNNHNNHKRAGMQILTEEQEKKQHISGVLQSMRGDTRTAFTNEIERAQDDKSSKLEQISSLKNALSEEGIDVNDIPQLSMSSPKQEIDSVLNLLLMKSNRTRYSTLAQEFVSGIAEGIEAVFDGTREIPILGWKPDYTGYQNTVSVKLSRMKFETSQVVGDILEGNNITPVSRILLELLPSLVLYPKTRARQKKVKSSPTLTSVNNERSYQHIRDRTIVDAELNDLKDI